MKIKSLSCFYVFKKVVIAVLMFVSMSFFPVKSHVKYLPSDDRSEAGMGIERVARFFTPAYETKPAQKEGEIRWVQIDLGAKKKIDGIKLLPRVVPWGYVSSEGFPARFKIEVSDDPEFKTSIMYENQTREDFIDPKDAVVTFSGKEVTARYVRLTGISLRQKRLAMTKIMVLSDSKDIAEGCPASDSVSGDLGTNLLTRPPRPQGEGVITDNPDNIISLDKWKPVEYKAQAPIGGLQLGDGLFKKTM